jgi:hypothetical protein
MEIRKTGNRAVGIDSLARAASDEKRVFTHSTIGQSNILEKVTAVANDKTWITGSASFDGGFTVCAPELSLKIRVWVFQKIDLTVDESRARDNRQG